jgi:ACR3 family arsenite transporter
MAESSKSMGLFARYLTLWVFLCIVTGITLGAYVPSVFRSLGGLEIAHINLPVAVLIWVMILPMLLKVDFSSLHEVWHQRRGIAVTLGVNWLFKPFFMALLG